MAIFRLMQLKDNTSFEPGQMLHKSDLEKSDKQFITCSDSDYQKSCKAFKAKAIPVYDERIEIDKTEVALRFCDMLEMDYWDGIENAIGYQSYKSYDPDEESYELFILGSSVLKVYEHEKDFYRCKIIENYYVAEVASYAQYYLSLPFISDLESNNIFDQKNKGAFFDDYYTVYLVEKEKDMKFNSPIQNKPFIWSIY